jgi:hypothetical protein
MTKIEAQPWAIYTKERAQIVVFVDHFVNILTFYSGWSILNVR